MAEGKRDRQIADELMISMDTVHAHTRKIFSKLDVHSRLEAVSVVRAANLRPSHGPGPDSGGQSRRPTRPTDRGTP